MEFDCSPTKLNPMRSQVSSENSENIVEIAEAFIIIINNQSNQNQTSQSSCSQSFSWEIRSVFLVKFSRFFPSEVKKEKL